MADCNVVFNPIIPGFKLVKDCTSMILNCHPLLPYLCPDFPLLNATLLIPASLLVVVAVNLVSLSKICWLVFGKAATTLVEGKKSGGGGAILCSADSIELSMYGFGIRRDYKGSKGILMGNLMPFIARLSELRVLSLPFNGFPESIPSEIWGMEKLEVLDLEGNLGFWSLPVSFSGLRNLRILNLAGNHINGTISGFAGGFKGVYLSLNQLGGSLLKEFRYNCEKLEHLDLSGSFLVGGNPSNLENCGNLRTLLYSNMFEEIIPHKLGKLGKLEVLDMSRTSLSGSVPPKLKNCSAFSVLVLSNMFDPYQDANGMKGDGLLDHLSYANEDFIFFKGIFLPMS
ncbi:hypothetical protein DKX38_024214 [Salix brachista]|uniref:Leucine-rich repeat-containing N-terminal plant-type domain-containing protein n=1 Tax=Salix brachista TaxID=2182728 RepID=A0A5N5JRZ1_9ROSI|nr:hypothetical protein DKX38_024214 [Salix brachista]